MNYPETTIYLKTVGIVYGGSIKMIMLMKVINSLAIFMLVMINIRLYSKINSKLMSTHDEEKTRVSVKVTQISIVIMATIMYICEAKEDIAANKIFELIWIVVVILIYCVNLHLFFKSSRNTWYGKFPWKISLPEEIEVPARFGKLLWWIWRHLLMMDEQ